jgi:Ser/Thr protein kinase RdoA (MazF antagonist)
VPIDFQDLVWAFEIQDLSISWSSLARYDNADVLREAFRSGYAEVRAWPELDEETLAGLVAARRLHQLNQSLTMRRPGLARYVEHALALIAKWMA